MVHRSDEPSGIEGFLRNAGPFDEVCFRGTLLSTTVELAAKLWR